jgi:hypothetical protein
MTEAEWLGTNKPLAMLECLLNPDFRERYPDSRFRLLACVCVRHLAARLSDRRSLFAIETAERYAQGLVGKRTLENARRAAQEVAIRHWQSWQRAAGSEAEMRAAQAAVDTTIEKGIFAAWEVCQSVWLADREGNAGARSGLLRELFGNPFRSPVLPEGWRGWNHGLLVRLAQHLQDEQLWEDLPVLADALEESGCRDEDILQHCRSTSGHVPGCWVLNLLLSPAH